MEFFLVFVKKNENVDALYKSYPIVWWGLDHSIRAIHGACRMPVVPHVIVTIVRCISLAP